MIDVSPDLWFPTTDDEEGGALRYNILDKHSHLFLNVTSIVPPASCFSISS